VEETTSGPEQSFSFTLASFYRWLESVGEAVLLVVLTLEISGGLPAQGTWVVDNQGGPGSHFLDIPPAVQAAAPNDTIVVRWGDYLGCVINKPLRLVGICHTAGAWAENPRVLTRLVIRDIPLGEEVLVANVQVRSGSWPPGLEVTNCAGRIRLESVWSAGIWPADMLFQDCSDVSTHYCILRAMGIPVTVRRSRLLLHSTNVEAEHPGPAFPGTFRAPAHALLVETGSEVTIQGGYVRGASGYWDPGGVNSYGGSSALELQGGTVRASAQTAFLTYPYYWGSPTPGNRAEWAIIGTGTLRHDPQTVITGVLPTIQRIIEPRYDTFVGQVFAGSSYTGSVRGPANGFMLMGLGNPTAQPIQSPFGDLWLDPCSLSFVVAGALDNDGRLDFTLFASSLTPIDQRYAMQAGLLAPDGTIRLANPAWFGVKWPLGLSYP
jgi:hypothetical protein